MSLQIQDNGLPVILTRVPQVPNSFHSRKPLPHPFLRDPGRDLPYLLRIDARTLPRLSPTLRPRCRRVAGVRHYALWMHLRNLRAAHYHRSETHFFCPARAGSLAHSTPPSPLPLIRPWRTRRDDARGYSLF
jgi:hypothetical protein